MYSQGIKKMKPAAWSKATTTNLVREVFETFFADQIAKDEKEKDKGPKKKRCGVCEACQSPDCGSCTHCRDMLKFGGTGRAKQACKQRRCPNMAIQDAEESENEDEDVVEEKDDIDEKVPCSKRILHKVEWTSDKSCEYKGRTYFTEAKVGKNHIFLFLLVFTKSYYLIKKYVMSIK